MSTNPFTLSALATTAVPGLDIVGATEDGSDEHRSVVAARLVDGETVQVVLPRSVAALTAAEEQLAQALADVRAAGGTPYPIPAGASDHPLGGLGFAGWADEVAAQERLGGILGVGTVLYALLIGPVVQFFLPLLTVRVDRPDSPDSPDRAGEVAEPSVAAAQDGDPVHGG